MWGKTTEREPVQFDTTLMLPPQERSAPPAVTFTQTPKPATIGKTMRLQGDILSDEELYMDGEMEGSLEVRHRLTIGPNGKVKANVKAQELVVRGWIQGNVEAAGRIVIMGGASIVGDVKTAGIVIEDGAFFKGGIDILHPEKEREEANLSTVPAGVRAQSAGA